LTILKVGAYNIWNHKILMKNTVAGFGSTYVESPD